MSMQAMQILCSWRKICGHLLIYIYCFKQLLFEVQVVYLSFFKYESYSR